MTSSWGAFKAIFSHHGSLDPSSSNCVMSSRSSSSCRKRSVKGNRSNTATSSRDDIVVGVNPQKNQEKPLSFLSKSSTPPKLVSPTSSSSNNWWQWSKTNSRLANNQYHYVQMMDQSYCMMGEVTDESSTEEPTSHSLTTCKSSVSGGASCQNRNKKAALTTKEEEEEEIVFNKDRNAKNDNETCSISSEYVQTGDAYWDAILLAALNDVPAILKEEEDDSSSNESDQLDDVVNDDESTDSASVNEVEEEEDDNSQDEWTNLTKDPAALEIIQATSRSSTPVVQSTILSDMLWSRDFDAVLERIQMHPQEAAIEISLPGSSDSKMEKENKHNNNNNNKNSRGFPLHLACSMRPLPPLSIFQALLTACPEAADKAESKWGMLPLHFAVNLLDSVNVNNNRLCETDSPLFHQANVVELLLSVSSPEAVIAREQCQGRTALHLAASTTTQSVDGLIPPASHAVLEILLKHATTSMAMGERDLASLTPQDIARGGECSLTSSSNRTRVCFAGNVDWKPNPLLYLSPSSSATAEKGQVVKKQHSEEEDTSHTDATSVTMSLSSSSMTEHDGDQEEDQDGDESNDPVQADNGEVKSISDDDATFVTARTSEEEQSILDPNGKRAPEETADESVFSQTQPLFVSATSKELDEDVESVLTTEQEESATASDEAKETTKKSSMSSASKHHSTRTQKHGMSMLLVQLQLHVSNLVRPRRTKAFGKSLFPPKKSINPYYKVELVQPETDVSVVLHESEPYYQRREALWRPIHFDVDERLAQTMGMVLRINLFHKRRSSSKKKDKLIGSHQASLWDLEESVKQIPLIGRNHQITGQMRLVSFEMKPTTN